MALVCNGTTQYARISSNLGFAMPGTLHARIIADTDTSIEGLVCVGSSGGTSNFYSINTRGDVGGNPVGASKQTGTHVNTTAGYTVGTLHTVDGVFRATNDWSAYLDGANEGNSTTTGVPSTNQFSIGCLWRSTAGIFFDGIIDHVAVWSAALTSEELLALYAGVDPRLIRPASLISYWPLYDNARDHWGQNDLSLQGSPSFVESKPLSVVPRGIILWPGKPAPQTVNLGVAAATGVGLSLGVVATNTVGLGVGEATASGLVITPTPGAVSKALGVASGTAEGLVITPAPGSVSVGLGVAAASAVGLPIGLVATNTVGLGVAEAIGVALGLTPAPGAASAALGVSVANAIGLALGLTPGAASKALGVAAGDAVGLPLTVAASNTVSLGFAAADAVGLPLTLTSTATVSLGVAEADAVGLSLFADRPGWLSGTNAANDFADATEWVDPGDAVVADGVYTTVTLTEGATARGLNVWGFDFDEIPGGLPDGATLTGFEIEVLGYDPSATLSSWKVTIYDDISGNIGVKEVAEGWPDSRGFIEMSLDEGDFTNGEDPGDLSTIDLSNILLTINPYNEGEDATFYIDRVRIRAVYDEAGVVNLGVAAADAVGLSLTVIAGAASVGLGTAEATAVGLPITVTAGAVSATLETAEAAAVGLPLTVTNSVSLPLGIPEATAVGLPITVTSSAAVSLGSAVADAVALPLAMAPGPVSVSLGAASATAEANPLGLLIGAREVALGIAAAIGVALGVSVTPGAVSKPIGVATATAQAMPLSSVAPNAPRYFSSVAEGDIQAGSVAASDLLAGGVAADDLVSEQAGDVIPTGSVAASDIQAGSVAEGDLT